MERQLGRFAAGSRLLDWRYLTSGFLRASSSLTSQPSARTVSSVVTACDVPCTGCAMWTTQRRKTTYSVVKSARVRKAGHKSQKQYNYLTHSRMVDLPRKETALELRRRDDKALARRQQFKEQLQRDVQEKIRFFSPLITKNVFFPINANNNRSMIFRGHRDMGVSVTIRVTCDIIEQLKKYENRPFLLEKMAELHIEAPTAAEWKKYTDAASGDINIGILYSDWMENMFLSFSRDAKLPPRASGAARPVNAVRDYIALHAGDGSLVLPLEEWARGQGPVKELDIVGRAQGSFARQLERKARAMEVRLWGKAQVMTALSLLPNEAQMAMLEEVSQRRAEILRELEQRHLFITKFKEVLCSLDEMKAITVPSQVHNGNFARKFVISHGGAYYPPYKRKSNPFSQLSKEEKARLCPFGYRHEAHPTTGQKLYIRCCVRDYGYSVSEAARRYSRLSDLQRAAVCFPFYLSIAPVRASRATYKRFYLSMCAHYGLSNASGPVLGNMLFEAAMRRRWSQLTPTERARYEEADRISDVFPLIKPTSSSSSAAASATTVHAADTPEYFTEDDTKRSSSVDDLLSPTPAHDTDEDEEMLQRSAEASVEATASSSSTSTSAASAAASVEVSRKAVASHTSPLKVSDAVREPPRRAAAVAPAQKMEVAAHEEGLRVIMM